MQPATCLRVGAILGGVGVAVGAFAAHGMKGRFDAAALQTFDTGVLYHLLHALALVACAALGRVGFRIRVAGALFVAGIVLFSGSLYVLVLTGTKWLGAVTPIGGVCWLAGWVVLSLGGSRGGNAAA